VRKEIGDLLATEIDYVAVVDKQTFQTIEKTDDKEYLLLTAVRFGDTRLIDNILLDRKQ